MKKLFVDFNENIKVVSIDSLEVIYTTSSTQDLMTYLLKGKDNKEIYIHDLSFNGAFISYDLKDRGYVSERLDSNRKKLSPKTYQKLVSENGMIYLYKIKKNSKYGITIYDTSKLFVQDIETIRTKVFKDNLDSHLVIPTLVKRLHEQGHTKMTVGANAFRDFLGMRFEGNWLKFKDTFPSVDMNIEKFIRHSYRGGWVYGNRDFIGKERYIRGIALDVNSLFPYVMKACILPYGEPKYFKGEYKEDKFYPLYLQKVKIKNFCLKNNRVPMIPNRIETGYLEQGRIETLTLTNMELELLKDSYDMNEIEYIEGYKFRGCLGIFDEYIKKYGDMKIKATNEVDRMFAKLFLNNLYGKFGTKFVRQAMEFKFNEETGIEERKTLTQQYKTKQYYTAMSSFITSYARCITIKGANDNFERFIYADTDSLHLVGDIDDVENLKIDDRELGAWKVERNFDHIKVLGLKKYMEYDIDKKEWKVVCAGLPEKAKQQITSPEQFEYGAKFEVEVKENIVGGAKMKKSTFGIYRDILCNDDYDDMDIEELLFM